MIYFLGTWELTSSVGLDRTVEVLVEDFGDGIGVEQSEVSVDLASQRREVGLVGAQSTKLDPLDGKGDGLSDDPGEVVGLIALAAPAVIAEKEPARFAGRRGLPVTRSLDFP